MSDFLLELDGCSCQFSCAQKLAQGKVTERVHAPSTAWITDHRGETLGIVANPAVEKHAGATADGHAQNRVQVPVSAQINGRRYADGISGPFSSLDPRLPVWRIITEPVWIQQRRSERERRQLG